jgi:hypothetical protein
MDTNGRKLDTVARLAKQILAVVLPEESAENAGAMLGPPCLKCRERKPGRYKRDMCRACYQEADRAIRNKETTWEELERLGIAGPASKGGRPSKADTGKGLMALVQSLRLTHQPGVPEGSPKPDETADKLLAQAKSAAKKSSKKPPATNNKT